MTDDAKTPPPAATMSLEELQHWTQMLGRAQQLMLEQGIDLLERSPALPDPTTRASGSRCARDAGARGGTHPMMQLVAALWPGLAAALPLAPLARFADLDGPTWLAVDVEPALRFSTGVLHL